MDLLLDPRDLDRLDTLRRGGGLTLVPTMGALHEGHLDLVRRAAAEGPVVVSIFVNPTQFGPGEDFAAYPRDLESDLARLRPLEVAAVFAPAVGQMYAAEGGARVRPGDRADCLCGAARPGHFDGVVTIVAKLFNLVRPDVAIFGRKDAQQCLVIDQMVRDLGFPVRLIDAPTVREEDGLAMSSRNRYLDLGQRERAVCLSAALSAAGRRLEEGERSAERLLAAVRDDLAPADSVEYAELCRVPDLQPAERAAGRVLLALAARVGPARLIDNRIWNVNDAGVRETGLLAPGENP